MPLALLLSMALLLPVGLDEGWEVLAFRGIPANVVAGTGEGLEIRVDRSAGPLVWPLAEPTVVGRVSASGLVTGSLNTTAREQGSRGHDDFTLRLGLVEAGARRPGFFERRFAPDWVKRLFRLAPEGSGVGRLRFFNLGLDPAQVGWKRRHPASDLVVEEVVAVPDADGRFSFSVETGGVQALAVWLSADGDDTGSSFTVRLDRLALMP